MQPFSFDAGVESVCCRGWRFVHGQPRLLGDITMAKRSDGVKVAVILAVGGVMGNVLPGIIRPPDPQLVGLENRLADMHRTIEENQKELNLNHAEIEQLKQVGTDQLLAMMAAAGGVGGKTGKTRSHTEIEKLGAVVEQITSEVKSTPRSGPEG